MAGVERHTEDWRTLPWKKIQREVRRLQQRIYRAERRGDHQRARSLQRLLLKSRCALCGLRFVVEDIVEVHHRDGDRTNNRYANLVLLHAHCHDEAHRERYL